MPPDPPTMARTYKSYKAPGTRPPPPQYFMKCPPLVETQRCESCYQEQKYKNKRYISLSHVIRQTLNPPFLREKWLN